MRMSFFGRLQPRLALGVLAGAGLALTLAANSPPAAAGDALAPDVVSILDAQAAGDLGVTVRGQGEDRVHFEVVNRSNRRLQVVIPPGLVAAATSAQGFQSMGLGGLSSNPGRFGAYHSAATPDASGGFRSVPAVAAIEGLGVSPGQTLEFSMPSVCLNFGVNTPTPRDEFQLVSVEQYTSDPRARKALLSLATLGTSQGVAQAVAWHVFNGLSFPKLAAQRVKPVNTPELGLAIRFVEALDASGPDGLVDPAYLEPNRVLLHLTGAGSAAEDAQRLATQIDGLRVLGLPVQVVDDALKVKPRPGSMLLNVAMGGTARPDLTSAKVQVRAGTPNGGWTTLGTAELREPKPLADLTGVTLADAVGRAVARTFVTVVPIRRAPGSTVVKITNRLPMTLAHLTLKAGKSAADLVPIDGAGIGPIRSASVSIPAASASVDHVLLNGL